MTVKETFAERFKALRQQHSMNQAQFSSFLGIARPTVGFYENATRQPDATTLAMIAQKCGISSDYLLGLVDMPTPEIEVQAISAITGLTDETINTLRRFNAEDHQPGYAQGANVEALNKALSRPELLNLLATILSIDNGERGYFDGCEHTPGESFYDVRLSPDSYAAYLLTRLTQTMTAIREGRQLSAYAPQVKQLQDEIKKLRKQGRTNEQGAHDHAQEESQQ